MGNEKFSNNKILIVDDEPTNLKILRLRLDKEFEIREAASGEEALQVLEDGFKPGLILLDIMMDGLSGYEVTQKIKQNPKTGFCKVILVSGKGMIEEKLEGYRCGADDYITKPFNGEELKAKIRVYLKLFNLEDQLERMNHQLEEEVQLRTEQLIANERMAYLGMQVSEIVHNLNNPLAVIKGYVFRLEKKDPDSAPVKKIREASDKILDYVQSILSTIRRDIKKEMQEVDIDRLVDSELEFISTIKAKSQLTVKKDLSSKAFVFASETHLSQIISNLIKNSVDAMIGGEMPTLKVSTRVEDENVIIDIQDNGSGISPENLQKVFEPTFTTKTEKENSSVIGTGLGLSFCKRMVESYAGKIEIESEVGKGTSVHVIFPAQVLQNS